VEVFATWSIPYHDYAAMPAVVRLDVEEVTMSTTDGAARTLPRHTPTKFPEPATKGPARLRSAISAGVRRLA
jgi:hypothetical protein